MKTRIVLLAVIAAGFLCSASETAEHKKWLVVDDMPRETNEDSPNAQQESDFPRLLIMQISKADIFRCCDRSTYKIQARELATAEDGDVEMTSAGYAISWLMRSQKTEEGDVLTVSLGYNNIGKTGNNELITSEDVVVKERDIKGIDILMEVARLSARAILFRLRPPQVIEVSEDDGDGRVATTDYGRDFFSAGEKVSFTRKVERKGREFYKRVGVGVVVSASADTSCVQLISGTVQEDDYVELFTAGRQRTSEAKYALAMCYLRGEDVPQDPEKAERLLQESAEGGSEKAKKELKRLCDERAAEELRITREKAEKRGKIEAIQEVESEITDRKARINSILKGKLGGDWEDFDAGKITQTDSSISVKTEEALKQISGTFSENDSLGKLNEALRKLQAESERLEARLAEIAKVKGVYDAKELESRKETCTPCGGTGTIECARCKGKGEVVVKVSEPCPICSGENSGWSGSHRRGVVMVEVDCGNCRGTGEIAKRQRCRSCGGKGKLTIEEPGRLRSRVRCDSCGGSGWGEEYTQSCPRCHGNGKVEVQRQCSGCGGKGVISSGSNVTCSACGGKGSRNCERCDGSGFTYRAKQ